MKSIEELLRNYLQNKGKIRMMEIEIEGLKQQLSNSGREQIENDRDCIEGMQMGSKPISDMPISRTNKFHSATEDTALNYRKEMVYKIDREAIQKSISDLESKMSPLQTDVKIVDIFVESLYDEEKLVIDSFYIKGLNWTYVGDVYLNKYRQYRSVEALKNKRDEAIMKYQTLSA